MHIKLHMQSLKCAQKEKKGKTVDNQLKKGNNVQNVYQFAHINIFQYFWSFGAQV